MWRPGVALGVSNPNPNLQIPCGDVLDESRRGRFVDAVARPTDRCSFSSAKWARRAAERRTSPRRPQRTSSSRWRCHGRYHTAAEVGRQAHAAVGRVVELEAPARAQWEV